MLTGVYLLISCFFSVALCAGDSGILGGVLPINSPISLLLIQMLMIILTCRVLAVILKPLRQPEVVGQILCGIVLGPSVFGLIPGYMQHIFPSTSMPLLDAIGNIGLIFYLFLVGLELDPSVLKKQFKESFSISMAGILVPFALAIGTSTAFYKFYMLDSTVPFGVFFLFIGVSCSITAFPVLARIMNELRLFNTPVGTQCISAAAIDDAAAWSLLALVIAIAAGGSPLNIFYIVLMTVGFAVIMIFLVSPVLSYLLNKSVDDNGNIGEGAMAVMLIIVLLSALITDIIGVHAIFGAFIAGLAAPRSHEFDISLTEKIEDLVTIIFLPVYFALSGLRTKLGSLNSPLDFGMIVLALATACLGKMVGCAVAGKLAGLSIREAFSVGILMNAKGLVELVVLNIGLDAKLINDVVFAILVLTAVLTTAITVPLLSIVYPPRYYQRAKHEFTEDGMDEYDVLFGRKFKPLVLVPCLRNVPGLMNFLELFSKNDPNESINATVTFDAVRLIEGRERYSNILRNARKLESMQRDPVLQVFKTYASLNRLKVNTHIAMNSVEELAIDSLELAQEIDSNMIIVPITHPSNDPLVNKAVKGTFSYESMNTIAKKLLTYKDSTYNFNLRNYNVGVLLDRGFDEFEVNHRKNVLVVFTSGSDDREAVMMAIRMVKRSRNVNLVIMRFQFPKEVENPVEGGPAISLLQEFHVETDNAEAKNQALLDDKLFSQLKEQDLVTESLEEGLKNNHKAILKTVFVQSGNPLVYVKAELEHGLAVQEIVDKQYHLALFGYENSCTDMMDHKTSSDYERENYLTNISAVITDRISSLLSYREHETDLRNRRRAQASDNGKTASSLKSLFSSPDLSRKAKDSNVAGPSATKSPKVKPVKKQSPTPLAINEEANLYTVLGADDVELRNLGNHEQGSSASLAVDSHVHGLVGVVGEFIFSAAPKVSLMAVKSHIHETVDARETV